MITPKNNRFFSTLFDERLKQATLEVKTDRVDFIEKVYFQGKLKNINKKLTSNKAKHVEAEKELTDLSNKVPQV